MKNSSDHIGNRTRDLLVRSVVRSERPLYEISCTFGRDTNPDFPACSGVICNKASETADV
jgi:hypothetical protein